MNEQDAKKVLNTAITNACSILIRTKEKSNIYKILYDVFIETEAKILDIEAQCLVYPSLDFRGFPTPDIIIDGEILSPTEKILIELTNVNTQDPIVVLMDNMKVYPEWLLLLLQKLLSTRTFKNRAISPSVAFVAITNKAPNRNISFPSFLSRFTIIVNLDS